MSEEPKPKAQSTSPRGPEAKPRHNAPPAAPVPQQTAPMGEEMVADDGSGMPEWLDIALPWAASVMLHLGIGLLVLFMIMAAAKIAEAELEGAEPIIIPQSNMLDPSLGPPGGVPNPGIGGDPTRDAAQDKIKDVLNSDGFAQQQSDNTVASMLEGDAGDAVSLAIGRGAGGSMGGGGNGAGRGQGGPLAPYGTPGGGTGIGPKSNFYGSGGNATEIVYILDYSGSMVDYADFLRQEVSFAVDALVPLQKFNVITFGGEEDGTKVLLPKGQLHRATEGTKRALIRSLEETTARGYNDDRLEPFQTAFREAFAMKPQLIYFLTDGKFDPRLIEEINKLNKDRKVFIFTYAFVKAEKDYHDQLRDLATANKGKFKFVSKQEAENRRRYTN